MVLGRHGLLSDVVFSRFGKPGWPRFAHGSTPSFRSGHVRIPQPRGLVDSLSFYEFAFRVFVT
jgi:hypothetical protein